MPVFVYSPYRYNTNGLQSEKVYNSRYKEKQKQNLGAMLHICHYRTE